MYIIRNARALVFGVVATTFSIWTSGASAALIFKIDVDFQNENGAMSPTESDWTSLLVNDSSPNSASVTVSGVTFDIFSADGARDRNSGGTSLTRDFVFDDGSGQAVGLTVSGLPAGWWQASVYSYDASFSAGNQIVGITQFGASPESIYTSSFASNANTPFTFKFDSSALIDGFGIFTRENNSANRARFNALELRQVPAPATLALISLGLLGFGIQRRK